MQVQGVSGQSAVTLDQTGRSRITATVSDSTLSTLKGNVHPLALPRYDRGPVPSTMPTGRMMLLLRRSDAQSTALHQYLAELQNPASAHYRQWLTPTRYGASYGIADADLAEVTGWLARRGFKIEHVPAARNLVVFSGTAGAIQSAFHTSIHSYFVHGDQHYANASDPQIPAALLPVVAGISPMNDFRAKPQNRLGPGGAYDPQSNRIRPQLTLNGGTSTNPVDLLFVDPADAATIYNTPNSLLNRNYSASKSLDGTGVTIGVLGYSDLVVSDVQNYRTAFLNDSAHPPKTIIDGNDPGVLPGGDAIEALLDTEIAGGLAPGAAINYYNAASTDLADGLTLAALRALDDNLVSILNVSYGNCEANLGASGNLLFSELWEQAASQGISVVVSSGDSGSAACDDDHTERLATHGLAVSGIASTPYNLVVGGTDFVNLKNDFGAYAQLTGGAPPYYGTALGYIAESTWNDSITTNGLLSQNVPYVNPSTGDTNIVATAGGLSSISVCSVPLDSTGNCTGVLSGYPKPAFQQSVTGSDGVRDLPDVAFLSAVGKENALWALCSDNVTNQDTSNYYTNCQTTGGVFTSDTNFGGVGGTSTAAPAFAGMLALVSQSLGGVRLGQANNILYNLAAKTSASTIFNTVEGNNSVPCVPGSLNCNAEGFLTGYNAGPGYSEAAGLGSTNVTALVNAWTSAAFTATSTSLSVGTSSSSLGTGSISVTHGTPLYFSVAVTPSGVVGDVSVTNTSGVTNNAASFSNFVTLGSDGTGAFNTNNLPGGTYTISSYYEGDATHSASTSAPAINVTVAPEASTTALSLRAYDPATGQPVHSVTLPYGYYGFISAQPYGNNSTKDSQGNIIPDGIPTGLITFDYTPYNFLTSNINSIGVAQLPLGALSPGNYNIQATYSGDSSFGPSTSTAIETLTVTKAPTTISVQLPATSEDASGSIVAVITLMTDSVGSFPNGGAINLVANGISFGGGVFNSYINGVDAVQADIAVSGSELAPGLNTLNISFDGDSNYLSSATTASITLTAPASFTLAGPASAISISAPGQSGTGSVTLAPANGFTGAVSLTCSVAAISAGPAPTCSIPSSETISGTGAATATLTVSTTAGTAAYSLPLHRFFLPGGGIALGCLVLTTLPRRRTGWPALLTLLLLLGGGVLMTGCGGSSGSGSGGGGTPGTPAGSYTVTVTGTSGTLSATTKVTVTVQ